MKSFEDFSKEMLEKFKQVNNIVLEEMEEKATMCVGEIMARTPVKSGTLRRSMTHTEVKKVGKIYSVKVGSRIEVADYAEAVEEGHKQTPGRYIPAIGKKLVQSFVPGRHMIGDSIEIYQRELQDSIKNRIKSEVK
jgi:hypothetical protein